mmetsp:Transcript_2858/g.10079  ORF Transcript_2858/g.10079 Transcript_2858/m.10079 type:complete len:234 (+) Transcript_2858:1504-2205(+)
MTAMCLPSSSCSARLTVKLSSALTVMPMSVDIFFQWRSRKPGLRSAVMRGRLAWNASMRSLSFVATSCGSDDPPSLLRALMLFMVERHRASTSFAITSGSSCVKGPSVQSGSDRMNCAQFFHSVALGSKFFTMVPSCGYSVIFIPKISSRWAYSSESSRLRLSFASMSCTYARRSSTSSMSPYSMKLSTSVAMTSISSTSVAWSRRSSLMYFCSFSCMRSSQSFVISCSRTGQ